MATKENISIIPVGLKVLGNDDKSAQLELKVEIKKTEEKKKRKKDTPECSYERFTFICDKFLASKIRALAQITGQSIRTIMEDTIIELIDRYEKENGPIEI